MSVCMGGPASQTLGERPPATVKPELSLIMPCYNEQRTIPFSIPQVINAFAQAGHRIEIVACDNGSTDRTWETIQKFAADGFPVVPHQVKQNEGYGNGILSSISVCAAPWIGIIHADGQVDAEDAARLFDVIKLTDGLTIGKVRRRFRLDGVRRKIVSILYNGFIWLLWPRLGSIDVNGSPKIVHRDVLAAMRLESRDWFIDPEMMIKAHYLGVRVLEMNVFARMRSNGLSHVRPSAMVEFFVNLMKYRFGGALTAWRRAGLQVQIRSPDGARSPQSRRR